MAYEATEAVLSGEAPDPGDLVRRAWHARSAVSLQQARLMPKNIPLGPTKRSVAGMFANRREARQGADRQENARLDADRQDNGVKEEKVAPNQPGLTPGEIEAVEEFIIDLFDGTDAKAPSAIAATSTEDKPSNPTAEVHAKRRKILRVALV